MLIFTIQINLIIKMKLFIVSLIVFVVNLPFGYWRAGVKKFSKQWFLAVHIPVPIVIALRIFSGLGWQFVTYPALVGAFFLGQYFGGVARSRYTKNKNSQKAFEE